VSGHDLDANTVGDDLSFLVQSIVVSLPELGESELFRNKDVTSSIELVLGSSESLHGELKVSGGVGSDGHEDGSNVDSGGLDVRLSPSVSHTGLESIGSSARKHLVDADNVPGMGSDSHVEGFLTALGNHVLVSGNTGGLKGLGGELLLLTTDEMDASGELFPSPLLHTTVVHTELGVGDTSVESGFGVRLVLLVSEALSGSASHIVYYKESNNYSKLICETLQLDCIQ
jgi:hypothetical protein